MGGNNNGEYGYISLIDPTRTTDGVIRCIFPFPSSTSSTSNTSNTNNSGNGYITCLTPLTLNGNGKEGSTLALASERTVSIIDIRCSDHHAQMSFNIPSSSSASSPSTTNQYKSYNKNGNNGNRGGTGRISALHSLHSPICPISPLSVSGLGSLVGDYALCIGTESSRSSFSASEYGSVDLLVYDIRNNIPSTQSSPSFNNNSTTLNSNGLNSGTGNTGNTGNGERGGVLMDLSENVCDDISLIKSYGDRVYVGGMDGLVSSFDLSKYSSTHSQSTSQSTSTSHFNSNYNSLNGFDGSGDGDGGDEVLDMVYNAQSSVLDITFIHDSYMAVMTHDSQMKLFDMQTGACHTILGSQNSHSNAFNSFYTDNGEDGESLVCFLDNNNEGVVEYITTTAKGGMDKYALHISSSKSDMCGLKFENVLIGRYGGHTDAVRLVIRPYSENNNGDGVLYSVGDDGLLLSHSSASSTLPVVEEYVEMQMEMEMDERGYHTSSIRSASGYHHNAGFHAASKLGRTKFRPY